MKEKLRNFFTNRWVLVGLGLILLALVIWFVGPAFAFYDRRPLGSVTSRIVLILLVILVFAAYEGWKVFRDWRANKQMLAALTEGEGHDQNLSAREVADLKQRFEQAVTTLKKARFENKAGGGRSYLYQLPWYVFIGAPGSGKTTALINSGLRFPLADKFGKDAIKGVGGTRNCDWWFTDEAVLLDTAGRYTTQSSNQTVDSSAWQGFLKLIRKFRPRQPLNGAIITLSVSDLLTQTPAERQEYGRAVHQRIQELYGELGCRFPLYIMVTKCDLLAGFMEFYGDLGREDRAQVWGSTFEYRAEGGAASPLNQFDKEFDGLSERLYSRLFGLIEAERDPQRRALMYAFPQQFTNLKPLIGNFLQEVFGSSAFEEQGMLRGVYFTSGTQEGSPIDRVLGTLSRAFGLEREVLPPSASSGKSYFITRFMRDVAFAESDLTGQSERIEQRNKRIMLAGYAAAGLLAVLLVAGWMVSYFRNQTLVHDIDVQATEIKKQAAQMPPTMQGSLTDILPVLNAVRDLPAGYGQRDKGVPLTLGLGLYQGDKLGAQAGTVYFQFLRDAFLPRIALRLEEQIRSADNPDIRYEALKTYLMLYDAKHLDVEAAEAWIKADWLRTLSREISEADRANLAYHLRVALIQQPIEMVLPLDKGLVDEARRALASAPLAQRAYARLKLIGGGANAPDFRISDAAGPSAPLALTRASGKPLTEGVPGLFSVRGFKSVFPGSADALVKQLAEEESWVLGSQYAGSSGQNADLIKAEVQRLYLADYIRTWDEMLGDLRLVQGNSLAQSIQTISLLSAGDSPLKMLIIAVAKETTLAPPPSAGEAAAKEAGGQVMNRMRQTVDRIMGADTSKVVAAATAEAHPEAMVDRHFEQLRNLVAGAPGAPMPIDAVLNLLKEYEIQLRATEEAIKRGAPPPTDAMMIARIKSEADRLPPPARNLLESLINRTTGQAASVAQEGLKKAMSGGVGQFCKQALAGRYPFSRSSGQDVALGDFARLFGPGGTMDQFFRTNLQGFVDASGPTWKPIKLTENVSSVSPATVAQFQRASVIRDAFFPGGSPNPGATAELYLVKLEDGLNEVTLVNEGQTISFRNGRGMATRLVWPSMNPGNQVKLTASPGGTTLSADGPWALFRLLDQAKIEGGSSDRYHLTFSLDGRRATFELRATSVRNPFRLRELSQFSCPN
ncbi:MAG: type VI secretion system membrane subunit TssM [Thiobacillus sp.]|nr:type VI secretion system membrane subunit TssM [Thiobacillus sp.]